MAKLNLDRFQLLWFCEGFIGKSHLRWDGYQIMVDKVFPQLTDKEREFIYTYVKRDFKWHWEDKKFLDETPYRYWLQMLARFNPANQVHVWLKDGTEVDAYRWDGHYYIGWQRYCADDAIVRMESKPYTMCRNTLCRNNMDCIRFTQRKEGDVADPNIWITDKCDLLISDGSESGYEEKEEDDGRGV